MRSDDTTRIMPAAPTVEPATVRMEPADVDPGSRAIIQRTASGRYLARPYDARTHAAVRRARP